LNSSIEADLVSMSDVTQILQRLEQGDGQAAEELLPLVYDDLRKAAAAQLSREASGHTLQPTALVHEAYVRLVDREVSNDWNHRGHFFAAAAEAMRRILVEHARKKKALKRGGARRRTELDPEKLAFLERRDDLLALDEALDKLSALDSRKSELVKLRYFAGLTMPQAAEALGISLATAERDWKYSRVWLLSEMTDER
jgi:RNA polymerase sigma factor (TIGR02999 family)